jgi:formate hydrogenlyase transcriptional activator
VTLQKNDPSRPVPVGGARGARQGEGEPRRRFYAERRSLDRLLVPLSLRCLNAPFDQLDREVEKGLEEVNSFFGGDRVLLWEFSEDGQQVRLTHSFAGAGVELPVSSLLGETLPYIFDRVRNLENLCVSQPEDLPQAARLDQQYMERSGIRSFIVIPLIVGGTLRGALSLASIRIERAWSNEELFNFQRIGTVIAGVLDRKRSHEMLEQRMRFETLISDLSARLIKAPMNEVDREIEQALEQVREIFQADRCGLLGIFADRKYCWVTHASYGEGIEPLSGDINLAELFPWSYERLVVQGSNVNISRMEDLPTEAETERRSWSALGIRSSLTVPLYVEGRVSSLIVLNAVRRERSWSEEFVPRLQLLGEIIIGALERRRTDAALRKSEERFRQVAENVSDFIWEVDAQGLYRYTGPAVEKILGYTPDELIGKMHFYDLFAPDIREELKTAAFNVFAMKASFRSFPNPNVSKNGKVVHLETSGVPVLDEAGTLVGYRGSDTDVTERKRMEEQLQARVREIEQLKQRIEKENLYLREETSLLFEHGDIVGESAAMKTVLALAEQVARTDSTVLISGETGTGKELLAREIHNLSSRKDRPLVTVNCASLPPTLIESELFGREKGAYTGAMTRMAGRFEVADASTIFLDEIAELPLDLQSKLLRVIEDGAFERLGSTKTIQVNVRIIAATNRDLSQEVQRGAFREDLFYRLNVFPIIIPPLRARAEDIPLLVWAFVRHLEKKMGKQINSISRRSMEALRRYSWPGNVRELRNVIEHAMIVTRDKTLNLRVPAVSVAEKIEDSNLQLEAIERNHILTTLQRSGWRIHGAGGAAEALGLKRTTLQSKMKKLGIERPAN